MSTYDGIPVELPGHGKFWWIREPDNSGALAPHDHCTESGNLIFEALFGDSYAHVYPDGTIKRYNSTIGHRDDLVMLDGDHA